MKWRLAAKAACTTMASTFSGGCVAITYSMIASGGKVEVLATINGVLGALVGVTGRNLYTIEKNICCVNN